jgi:hypothetical protein
MAGSVISHRRNLGPAARALLGKTFAANKAAPVPRTLRRVKRSCRISFMDSSLAGFFDLPRLRRPKL